MLQRSLALLFLFSVTFETSNALYSKSSGVVDLNPNNFDSKVKNSDGVWIVEFFAPWCGHCKQLVPEYTKAAKALKVTIRILMVPKRKNWVLKRKAHLRNTNGIYV